MQTFTFVNPVSTHAKRGAQESKSLELPYFRKTQYPTKEAFQAAFLSNAKLCGRGEGVAWFQEQTAYCVPHKTIKPKTRQGIFWAAYNRQQGQRRKLRTQVAAEDPPADDDDDDNNAGDSDDTSEDEFFSVPHASRKNATLNFGAYDGHAVQGAHTTTPQADPKPAVADKPVASDATSAGDALFGATPSSAELLKSDNFELPEAKDKPTASDKEFLTWLKQTSKQLVDIANDHRDTQGQHTYPAIWRATVVAKVHNNPWAWIKAGGRVDGKNAGAVLYKTYLGTTPNQFPGVFDSICEGTRSSYQCLFNKVRNLQSETARIASVPYVHDLVCAISLSGNTRAQRFSDLRRNAYRLESRDRSMGRLLADPNITLAKANVRADQIMFKMQHRIEVNHLDVIELIGRGQRRFTESALATAKDAFDLLAWLHLVSGSRKTALALWSTYEPVKDTKGMRVVTRYGDQTNRFVHQISLTKKGEKHITLVKPLIGGVTSDVFLALLHKFRKWFVGRYGPEILALRDRSSAMKKRIGDRAASIRGAHHRMWSRVFPGGLPATFYSHQQRAVYAYVSFLEFASPRVNETFWIATVLGHNLQDLSTAKHYQGIFVSPIPSIDDTKASGAAMMAKASAIMDRVEPLVKKLQAKVDLVETALEEAGRRVEGLARAAEQGTASIELHDVEGRVHTIAMVSKQGNQDERRSAKRRKLNELTELRIPVTVRNLRAVNAYIPPGRR